MSTSPRPSRPATSRDEQPMFLDACGHTLFSVHTLPTTTDLGIGVVLLHGGSYTYTAHRNQLWQRIARSLAAYGFHTLRFDYHGIGDSTGVAEEFRMDHPFSDDAMAAVAGLRSAGVDEFILIGECFGARTALAAAASVDGLVGLFLIAPALHDGRQSDVAPQKFAAKYGVGSFLRRGLSLQALRKLGNRSARTAYRRLGAAKMRHITRRFRRDAPADDLSWVSEQFLDQLQEAVGRGVRIQFVFGTRDGNDKFQKARTGRLGAVLREGGENIEFALLEGKVHAELTRVATQNAVYDLVTEWGPRVFAKTGDQSTAGTATAPLPSQQPGGDTAAQQP
ncbi:MAG: alpha/beta fold hydrolase [Acidimicrobiia bacterium]